MQLGCSLLQESLTIRPEIQEALRTKLSEVLQPLDADTRQLVVQRQLQPRYYKLGYYLQQQQWREADYETYVVMLEVAGCTQKRYLDIEDIQQFPCDDLQIIDRLWVASSTGLFGFSVQKQIYFECGAKLNGKYPGAEIWETFGDRVGWRKDRNWLSSDNSTGDLKKSPKGEFPLMVSKGWFLEESWEGGVWVEFLFYLLSRKDL